MPPSFCLDSLANGAVPARFWFEVTIVAPSFLLSPLADIQKTPQHHFGRVEVYAVLSVYLCGTWRSRRNKEDQVAAEAAVPEEGRTFGE